MACVRLLFCNGSWVVACLCWRMQRGFYIYRRREHRLLAANVDSCRSRVHNDRRVYYLLGRFSKCLTSYHAYRLSHTSLLGKPICHTSRELVTSDCSIDSSNKNGVSCSQKLITAFHRWFRSQNWILRMQHLVGGSQTWVTFLATFIWFGEVGIEENYYSLKK
jgi:hypothetical protein